MAQYSDNSPVLFRNNSVDRQRYYRFVHWTRGDRAKAAELFQDANIKAYLHYGDSVETWANSALLYTVDRSVFCAWYRRCKHRVAECGVVSLDQPRKTESGEKLDDRLAEWLGEDAVAYKRALFRELREHLVRIGARLPASQLAILENCELSISELAEKLKTSRGSVKTQWGKLRHRLRDDARLYGLFRELLSQ